MWWRTCVVLVCVTAVLADEEWRQVNTAQGPVRGQKHPSGHLYAFYNVPYATAPKGIHKFKAPLPPPVRTEPFDAVNKNVVCPQYIDMDSKMPGRHLEQSEDCLIANIFVPDTNENNLPVLVYVHGGAFILGFGDMMRATQLMKSKDFIMVTFNYRLGIHGFLCLGTEDVPGNAGMKDQVALLRWVKDNIANFGGNPNKVTLAGYSAGSTSVDLLMLSKAAKGLFHRVIPESGANLAAFGMQRNPLEVAKSHAKTLQFTNVEDISALEQFYKTASMELLTADSFLFRPDSTFLFGPCVERDTEGAFLTESPLTILKNGDFEKLPMLYGFANMEGLFRIDMFNVWKDKMNSNFAEFLPADLKFETDGAREEVIELIKKFYFGGQPVSNDNILRYVDYFSDVPFVYPTLRSAKLQVEAGNDQVYLYEYSFVDENDNVVPHTNVRGADHVAQTVALMDGEDESLEPQAYQNMRKIIREIWHNFIITGTPVPADSSLPAWPPARADRSPHMRLLEKPVLQGVLLGERAQFWDDIYEKYYLDAVAPAARGEGDGGNSGEGDGGNGGEGDGGEGDGGDGGEGDGGDGGEGDGGDGGEGDGGDGGEGDGGDGDGGDGDGGDGGEGDGGNDSGDNTDSGSGDDNGSGDDEDDTDAADSAGHRDLIGSNLMILTVVLYFSKLLLNTN
nr:juvenile hormone esterase isoform X39 [Helicoverpa armigera]XP_049697866.1 juvenile hormone esterase isoform X40 [Helicoverpa armigera]XP_049697867.1 juvenile hormone esterase isoform X41 [Helicoverpa armigera]XP_049697868.1 juvenile hormone esterase isoform X42 [Helicoverpa armigera]